MSSSPPPTSAPPPPTSAPTFSPPALATSPPPSNSSTSSPPPLSSPSPPPAVTTPTSPPPATLAATPATSSSPPAPNGTLPPPPRLTPPHRTHPSKEIFPSEQSDGFVRSFLQQFHSFHVVFAVVELGLNGASSRAGSGWDKPFGQQKNCYNAPPPASYAVKITPNPSPPSPLASRPPHPPGNIGLPPSPVTSNSEGLGSNYSEPENSLLTTSPGVSLGLSKSTFSYEELLMATDGFSDANLLGEGGFGYVHRGMLPNGKEVAVKQLKSGSGQGDREFHAEVEIISRVHHKHLVSLVGYCISEGKRLLVYEFVPNYTLEFHLHATGRPTLDFSTRLKIARGSAKGLAYLHEDCYPKIIHRDIKASNILLDFKFEAKVADFGLAKLASETNTHVSTRVMGTFGYLAPEYASSGKLTDKSDVFSFGVMLLELITGRHPFDSNQACMDDSLVDWARPLLMRALDDGNFDPIVDPRLGKDYNRSEMRRMIACAAASVRHSAKRRPRMSQILRALEGDASLEDLNEGVKPGHSSAFGSYTSSDYDTMQYKEDMKRFRKIALGSQEHGSSGYSVPTSELGLNQSASVAKVEML
ncbi:hypothetical protein HPP92_005263 [Vanilla planifolia]|uniref:non-specific serine/threonine protein kinase n=1 Tax=Vanilla planifolia TaxID=51239 RepID=A0A835RPA7_VANPL|nr:hypothetical protein HPP92_005263 [Vanilla planifolia]